MAIYSIDSDELATILAALRFYQGEGMGEPDNRTEEIHEIATADDAISLDDAAIDDLCERLNTNGLTSAEAASIFGADQDAKEPHLKAYRDAAKTEEGRLEVDSGALVSVSDDGGAYVAAWVWVSDEEAGVTREDPNAEENA